MPGQQGCIVGGAAIDELPVPENLRKHGLSRYPQIDEVDRAASRECQRFDQGPLFVGLETVSEVEREVHVAARCLRTETQRAEQNRQPQTRQAGDDVQ